jgi:tripartite-type tricarboxylate transporter receptor subunit TctC
MNIRNKGLAWSISLMLGFAASSNHSANANVAEFYAGRTVNIIVGSGTGGGYDTYARIVARHIGSHIPGQPNIVVQNMPGAGSLNMTNFVANAGPKDGTAIGAPQNGVPFEPLFHLLSPGGKTARYDPKKLNWIGSAAKEVYVPFVNSAAGVADIKGLQTRALRFGATEPNTDNAVLALLLNRMFSTKIEVVHGYPGGTSALFLALERGEIDGIAGMSYASFRVIAPQLIENGKVKILTQIGLRKHSDLNDVPLLVDEAASDADRRVLRALFAKYEMARPYFVAEGVAADRVSALRAAFEATMKDNAFLEEARKRGLDIGPMTGSEIESLIAEVYRMPGDLVERVRKAVSSGK